MLKRVGESFEAKDVGIKIKGAAFPAPFHAGLEYSSPARGTWNIVHTGMLIPEAHQIFVCALGCLRGVVLTAAEMGAMDRYSAIMIKEENVLNGDMEDLMINGVTDIIEKLAKRPRAILLYISCQHFFLAYDQHAVFSTLRKRFPDIRFMDCYMIPTLRKSGLTPDQKMRIQMYSLWDQKEKNPKQINLLGSNIKISPSCEMVTMLRNAGFDVWDLYRCQDFEDYLNMASSGLNIYYEPIVAKSADELRMRIGQDNQYMSFSFDSDELMIQYEQLANRLEFELPDLSELRKRADDNLKQAKAVIGNTKIALDMSFTFRILSFAKMLLEYGFNLVQIYADVFLPEDRAAFEWIQAHHPEVLILPTNQPQMRMVHGDAQNEDGCRMLALGQKAAYFAGTDYFVNIVEGGGLYGFDGMCQIAELMIDAFETPKDRRTIIQRKGYTCDSCISI